MPQDNGIFVVYLIIFVIIYFMVIRPQQLQQKKTRQMLANLKKNDEVVTNSGMHGTVAIVKDKTVVLRVDEGCRIEFDREAIAVLKSNELKPEVVK